MKNDEAVDQTVSRNILIQIHKFYLDTAARVLALICWYGIGLINQSTGWKGNKILICRVKTDASFKQIILFVRNKKCNQFKNQTIN